MRLREPPTQFIGAADIAFTPALHWRGKTDATRRRLCALMFVTTAHAIAGCVGALLQNIKACVSAGCVRRRNGWCACGHHRRAGICGFAGDNVRQLLVSERAKIISVVALCWIAHARARWHFFLRASSVTAV